MASGSTITKIQGVVVDGVANSANPVPMGGVDGSGNVQTCLTNTSGELKISETAATSTLTNVTAATSDTQLLASTSTRKMAMFFNDADVTLLLKLGSGASATSFTVKLSVGDYYELPLPAYTGQINGIWPGTAGGTNAVRITELT